MGSSLNIDLYEIIDNKVKAELSERDRRNNSLRDELNRVRLENRNLRCKCIDLEESFNKIKNDSQLYVNALNNVKQKLNETEDINNKLDIINYYLQVILGKKPKYDIPTHVIENHIGKMISYLFYVYNDDKNIVRDFLMATMPEYKTAISNGYSIIVPQKVSKDVLMKLLYEQPFYTNGGHATWISCCFPKFPPYSEYMKNPLILDDEVFQCLCDNLCRKIEGSEFVKVFSYQDLNSEQLEKLGNSVISRADVQIQKYFFNNTCQLISLNLHRKFFESLGYSGNHYEGNYIFKYKDEVIEEALSKMDVDEFVKLYNGVSNGREKLLKMFFHIRKIN